MAQERLLPTEGIKPDWRRRAVVAGVAIAIVGVAFNDWKVAATGVIIAGASKYWWKRKGRYEQRG